MHTRAAATDQEVRDLDITRALLHSHHVKTCRTCQDELKQVIRFAGEELAIRPLNAVLVAVRRGHHYERPTATARPEVRGAVS